MPLNCLGHSENGHKSFHLSTSVINSEQFMEAELVKMYLTLSKIYEANNQDRGSTVLVLLIA